MNNSKLFQPLTISTMKLRNATFMAPMSLGYESSDGCVNERMQAYWLERARGGVGCIILDALSVDPSVPYLGNTLCFRGEEAIASYKAFTDKIHEAGACIIPQITHPGPESISAFMGIPPVASSVYVNSKSCQTSLNSMHKPRCRRSRQALMESSCTVHMHICCWAPSCHRCAISAVMRMEEVWIIVHAFCLR